VSFSIYIKGGIYNPSTIGQPDRKSNVRIILLLCLLGETTPRPGADFPRAPPPPACPATHLPNYMLVNLLVLSYNRGQPASCGWL
jgi:hypothetical protein